MNLRVHLLQEAFAGMDPAKAWQIVEKEEKCPGSEFYGTLIGYFMKYGNQVKIKEV